MPHSKTRKHEFNLALKGSFGIIGSCEESAGFGVAPSGILNSARGEV